MYIPKQFLAEDFTRVTDLVTNNPFGMLVTVDDGWPCISHLPFLFEPDMGLNGRLIGHMAKENVQWQSLIEKKSVLVVFNGPHGYVSPTWYADPGVPTWNYAVVHIRGKLSIIEDAAGVENILEKLTIHFELNLTNPWKLSFPVEKNKLLQMIVGFEIDIETMESKFKLSQNRSPQEQQNIVSELAKSKHSNDIELSKLMESYFSKIVF